MSAADNGRREKHIASLEPSTRMIMVKVKKIRPPAWLPVHPSAAAGEVEFFLVLYNFPSWNSLVRSVKCSIHSRSTATPIPGPSGTAIRPPLTTAGG